jgi:hypothetical protein
MADGSIAGVSACFRFFEVEVAAVSVTLGGFDLGSVRFCYKLMLRLSIGVKAIPRRT